MNFGCSVFCSLIVSKKFFGKYHGTLALNEMKNLKHVYHSSARVRQNIQQIF